jgi:hypothetical protein
LLKEIMLNQKLNKGDRVLLLHMEGEMVSPGTKGTVSNISKDPFEKDAVIYSVRWDDGGNLSLLSVTDAWKKIEEPIKESFEQAKWFVNNKIIIECFDTRFLGQFLEKVRQSGITNMFGASAYLYMGRERIENEFKYKNIHNEEVFEEVLDMADESQTKMIDGVMKVIEKEGEEVSVELVNRRIQRYSTLFLNYWMRLHGG